MGKAGFDAARALAEQAEAILPKIGVEPTWETATDPVKVAKYHCFAALEGMAVQDFNQYRTAMAILTRPKSHDPGQHQHRVVDGADKAVKDAELCASRLERGQYSRAMQALDRGVEFKVTDATLPSVLALFPEDSRPERFTREFLRIPMEASLPARLQPAALLQYMRERTDRAAGLAGDRTSYETLFSVGRDFGEDWLKALTLVAQTVLDGWCYRT